MAKKVKKVTKKAEVATLEQFTVGGNLDVSDVLAIVTSKAEERYTEEIDRCRAEAAELEEANAKRRATIKKKAAKEAVESHAEHVESLRAAVKAFGGTVSIVANHGGSLTNEGLTASVTITASKSCYHNCAKFTVTTKPSKELQELVKEVKETENQIRTLNNEAVSWKRKLNNVPMLERRYRARLASAKLQSSEDGQKLLSMLTDDLDVSILALPSC